MTPLALSLCWLGTGLWVLADAGRAQRALPLRALPPRLSAGHSWLLRALGTALLFWALLPFSNEQGGALGGVALLLSLTTALSLAVLTFPLRPRLYAASVGLAALAALAVAIFG